MAYSAVDDVGEAYETTRSLLLPFDLRRWLVLAVVVFFVSGATGFDLNGNLGFLDAPLPAGPEPAQAVAEPGFGVFVLLAGGALLVALAVAFVAAVMEFVFVRILERRDVRVRAYLRPNVSRGLSLFVLRVVVGLAVLASALFVIALAIGGGVAVLALLLVVSPVLVVALVGLYFLHRFTVDFVVPIMLVDDVGVLGGWRRLVEEIRTALPEYGVYALVRLGLGIVAAIVTGVGFTMVAIVVGIPFAIVGAAFYAVGAPLDPGSAVGVFLGALAVLYALVVTVAGVTLVQVPVSSYLRYYSLLVLADVSPAYDLVSDVRPGGGGDHPSPGGGEGPGGEGGAGSTAEDDEAVGGPEDVPGTRTDAGSDGTGPDDAGSSSTGPDDAGSSSTGPDDAGSPAGGTDDTAGVGRPDSGDEGTAGEAAEPGGTDGGGPDRDPAGGEDDPVDADSAKGDGSSSDDADGGDGSSGEESDADADVLETVTEEPERYDLEEDGERG